MSGRRLLFIPMYNCAPQITRTLAQLTPEVRSRFAEILLLDNGSTDGGPERALAWAREHLPEARVVVARNEQNYGLGGSHKVAFQHCLDAGHEGVVVFHGDDQGRITDLLGAIDDYPDRECVLGARFMRGASLAGYAPHRIGANVAFNALFSALSGRALWDLGSGLNFYTRRFLERRLWEGCSDDLTFNYHLILRTVSTPGPAPAFIPISWREDDQVSNAKLFSHGVTMLRVARCFLTRRREFLTTDHSKAPRPRRFSPIDQ